VIFAFALILESVILLRPGEPFFRKKSRNFDFGHVGVIYTLLYTWLYALKCF